VSPRDPTDLAVQKKERRKQCAERIKRKKERTRKEKEGKNKERRDTHPLMEEEETRVFGGRFGVL